MTRHSHVYISTPEDHISFLFLILKLTDRITAVLKLMYWPMLRLMQKPTFMRRSMFRPLLMAMIPLPLRSPRIRARPGCVIYE